MATLTEIREALATAVDTVANLNAYARVPNTITPPCAAVRPLSGEYHPTMGDLASGAQTGQFEIVILVPSADIENAQRTMDALLDRDGTTTTSVFQALNADTTLGGKCDDLLVKGWQDYGEVTIGAVDHLLARVLVEVYY